MGQLVFNNSYDAIDAALDGFGLAYAPEEIALPHLKNGKLQRVLEKWSPYWTAIISIIRAVASHPPRLSRWSTPRAIAPDRAPAAT